MSITYRPSHSVSDEEFMQLPCKNPGMRFERGALGELIVSPPTGTRGRYAFRPPGPVTDMELRQVSDENPGRRFERSAEGGLIVSRPTTILDSVRKLELAYQLAHYEKLGANGYVISPNGGVTLPDSAVFASDALWISEDRRQAVPDEDRDGFERIVPDIAFEMLSVNDDLCDMRMKADGYLANGTRLVVLLDPRSRSAELHRPGGSVDTRMNISEVDLDPELPGFRLDITSIFKNMRDRHLKTKSSNNTASSLQNRSRKT